jgi:hypothetical protein
MAVAANSRGTAKPRGKPFAPGQSGNPSGRPAVAKEFRERCREFMESEGWTSLISMAQDKKDRDRYRALDLLAAYAYGKPKQGVELTGDGGGPVMLGILTDDALDEEIRKLLPG